MKKNININTILTGAVLILVLVMFAWKNMTAEKGSVAVVRIDGTDKRTEISLEENMIHTVTEGNFTVTLEVKDGRVRFINSLCPDHICEGYGFISLEDESAICMPAGVAVIIE